MDMSITQNVWFHNVHFYKEGRHVRWSDLINVQLKWIVVECNLSFFKYHYSDFYFITLMDKGKERKDEM